MTTRVGNEFDNLLADRFSHEGRRIQLDELPHREAGRPRRGLERLPRIAPMQSDRFELDPSEHSDFDAATAAERFYQNLPVDILSRRFSNRGKLIKAYFRCRDALVAEQQSIQTFLDRWLELTVVTKHRDVPQQIRKDELASLRERLGFQLPLRRPALTADVAAHYEGRNDELAELLADDLRAGASDLYHALHRVFVERDVFRRVTWLSDTVCRFEYLTKEIRQERRRHSARRRKDGGHGRKHTIKRSGHVQEVIHEHHLVDAAASRLDDSPAPFPAHVLPLAEAIPDSLRDQFSVVTGTQILERQLRDLTKQKAWAHRQVYYGDPCITFGPYVIVAWGEEEHRAAVKLRNRRLMSDLATVGCRLFVGFVAIVVAYLVSLMVF